MPAGKQSSSAITITLDDSAGTARAITNHVLSMSAAELEALLQASTAYGDSFEEHLPTGMQRISPFDLTGFFDDTATTGPHVVMGTPDATPSTATRTLTLVFGNAKTFAGECFVTKYSVLGKVGALSEFACHIQPTGSWTWT